MKTLVVVDMQNDFISGTLGTPEAAAIVEKAADKIKNFDGCIIFTRDTHDDNYLSTQEGKKLPTVHCIKGTEGWKLCPEIEQLRKTHPVIDKPSFGSMELCRLLNMLSGGKEIESITLIGLCTDICVISNAILLKASFPEVCVKVDASCCAGVTRESHLRALEAMRMCQIDIVGE